MDPIDLGDIDLRALRTQVRVEDDELVLIVGDDDARVTFAGGLGSRASAILGAQRLASAAREFAEHLSYLTQRGYLAEQGKGERRERDEDRQAG